MQGECDECPNETVSLNLLNGEDILHSVLRFLKLAESPLPFGNNYPHFHVVLVDYMRRNVGAESGRKIIKTSLCGGSIWLVWSAVKK